MKSERRKTPPLAMNPGNWKAPLEPMTSGSEEEPLEAMNPRDKQASPMASDNGKEASGATKSGGKKDPSKATGNGSEKGVPGKVNPGSEKELLEAFRRHRHRCSNDFEYFCAKELVIDRKGGGSPVPFVLNRSQKYVWSRLSQQWEESGMIRANILKGRQQGMSTLIAALIFWKAVTCPCINATLVSKDYKSTKSLFDKIKRFTYERPIDKGIVVETCNLDEVRFKGTESLIRMSTARSEQSQRGSTNQALFLSEAPYWENGVDQVSALFDSVARVPGTIIILESTARGKDQLFYGNYQLGLRPDSDWTSIFVPWYWQEEYRIPLKAGESFEATGSEQLLVDQYGLDVEQLKWRRNKLMEYRRADPLVEFRREYPLCPDDCFETSLGSTFFDVGQVRESMGNQPFDCSGENLYIGVDLGAGGDPSVACFRQGANVLSFLEYTSETLSSTCEWIEKLIRLHRPRRVYIDSGGLGLGTSQELSVKYGGVVRGINFGERPDDIENYANKRAEMFDRVRCYFAGGPISLCANDILVGEMQAISVEPDKPKLTIGAKDEIRKVIGRSTNYLDALALTFAEETQFGCYGASDSPDVIFLPRPEPMMYKMFENCTGIHTL
jgi:hypothetical protein